MGYSDFGVYLGFRKLAGIRSVAPAVHFFDQSLGISAYAVEKNSLIHIWGCEMTALMADCIKISYSSDGKNYFIVKNYLEQNAFVQLGGHSPIEESFYGYGSPSLSKNYVAESADFIVSNKNYGSEEHAHGGMSRGSLLLNKGKEIHFDVLAENFIRAFKFYVEGYYKIEIDVSKSSLYKSLDKSYPAVYPESYPYDNFRKRPVFPWSPIDPSSYEHGEFLVSEVILKCVSKFDVISKRVYENITLNIEENVINGITLSTYENVCNISGLKVLPLQYEKKYDLHRNYGFLINIDSDLVDSYTVGIFDKNHYIEKGVLVKNLRNRIFDSTEFVGPADFVMQIPYFGSNGESVQPVDMRNSRFFNCKFNSVSFGSNDYKQIILDGSVFEGCEFENCSLSISCNNVIFKNCIIKNSIISKGFASLENSNKNAFIGNRIIETVNPFSFYGKSCSNLFAFNSIDSGLAYGNLSCFLNADSTDSDKNEFSGNIIIKNNINTSDGSPLHLGKISSYGNLIAFNSINSFGSISISEESSSYVRLSAPTYTKIVPYK